MGSGICRAEVDTLYSEPSVDGEIRVWEDGSLITLGSEPGFLVGDAYWIGLGPDYEGGARGYLSFYIDSLPDTITIYGATLKVRQYSSYGNSTKGLFPQWTGVPGGDTMYCLIDHINYGPEIDTLDWTAGDPGDTQTITSRFGVFSSTPDTGWRAMDVTTCVQSDIFTGRIRNQYRLRFPVLSDYDGYDDFLQFYTGNTLISKPYLVIDYVVGVECKPVEENNVFKSKVSNFPNPFKNATTIIYKLKQSCHVLLSVYDMTGRKMKTLIDEYRKNGEYQVVWDRKNEKGETLPAGIYYYRLKAGDELITRKTVILK